MSKQTCSTCRGSGIIGRHRQHGEATQCDCECGYIFICDDCGVELDTVDDSEYPEHYCPDCEPNHREEEE